MKLFKIDKFQVYLTTLFFFIFVSSGFTFIVFDILSSGVQFGLFFYLYLLCFFLAFVCFVIDIELRVGGLDERKD